MQIRKRLLSTQLTLAAALCMASSYVKADCMLTSGASTATVNLTLPQLSASLNPSESGQKLIASTTISASELASSMGLDASTSIWKECTGNLMWNALRSAISGMSPNQSGYLETGIDNLYLYLYAGNQTTGNVGQMVLPATGGGNWSAPIGSLGNGEPSWSEIGDIVLALYHTGPIRKGGIVSAGPLAELTLSEGIPLLNITMSAFKVDVMGCAVTTPVVNIEMDKSVFTHSFTGINSTAGNTAFEIEANCDSGLLPTLTFSGENENNDPAIFAFTNKGDDGAASGLGVQIKYKTDVIMNNAPVILEQTITDGVNIFPFSANYIQTEGAVKGGRVSTSLTYTLSYQ